MQLIFIDQGIYFILITERMTIIEALEDIK